MSQQTIMGNGNKVRGDITKKNTKITISIGTIFIIAVVACVIFLSSNNNEKNIIGTWESKDYSGFYITFFDNNTITITEEDEFINGKYLIIDGNTLKLNLSNWYDDYIMTANISIRNGEIIINEWDDDGYFDFNTNGIEFTFRKTK